MCACVLDEWIGLLDGLVNGLVGWMRGVVGCSVARFVCLVGGLG